MSVVMLVAGIGLVLAGLVAIGFGLPVKEFSFGNTLILTGVIAACSGVIVLGLWAAVRELKNIARRLGAAMPLESRAEITMPPAAAVPVPRSQAPGDGGFLSSRDQSAVENTGGAEPSEPAAPASPPPWHDEAASRDRTRGEVPTVPAPEPAEAGPVTKPKRNLLFSSTSRKERERAQARTSEPLPPDLLTSDLRPGPPAAPPEASEAPPATFDDAWPKADRPRPGDVPPQRRSGRTPSTFNEANGAPGSDRYPPAARNEDQPQVTVLKSGVVDGMAYSLYSDGSIEAQMPEGMMRFASIDELRSHLDQRP